MQSHNKGKVAYFYNSNLGNFEFPKDHMMQPYRVHVTHNLLLNYGLYKNMDICCPKPATVAEMEMFHSHDYIKFLRSVKLSSAITCEDLLDSYNFSTDCPPFNRLYEYCKISAGGTIAAAAKLNSRTSDICIHWGGGMHHAKRKEASGFCYVNDIVLGILELLKYHQRVLYVDIDVHHGDGVEQAFYLTDRVMTVSFHKFGEDFFPVTGHLMDTGEGAGKYYSVNVPLTDGMTDANYEFIFKPIMDKVMERYRPSVVVLQCGADSVTGDPLGTFNLSFRGHGKCVEVMKSYNVPLLMLGGGGYNVKNVARCWAYETSLAVGIELDDEMPYNDYLHLYPERKLHIQQGKKKNSNTLECLEKIKSIVLQNIEQLPHVPSVQMQDIPVNGRNYKRSKKVMNTKMKKLKIK